MVKSSTSSVFFPGEKSPNFPKFLERKLVSLDLKEKEKKISNLQLMMTSYITKIEKKNFWRHSALFSVKINTIWGREGEGGRRGRPSHCSIIIMVWHYEMKNFQVAANLQSIHTKHKSLVYCLIFHNNSSHGWNPMSVINSLVTWVKVAVGHNSLTCARTHTHTHILSYSKSKVMLVPSAPQSSAANRNYLVIEDVLNVVENGFKIKSKKVTH